jgi:hypothetical protein
LDGRKTKPVFGGSNPVLIAIAHCSPAFCAAAHGDFRVTAPSATLAIAFDILNGRHCALQRRMKIHKKIK